MTELYVEDTKLCYMTAVQTFNSQTVERFSVTRSFKWAQQTRSLVFAHSWLWLSSYAAI